MSTQAPNWYTTQYDSRVIQIYQTKGNRLRPTVTPAAKIENASTAVFWKAGLGIAYRRRHRYEAPQDARLRRRLVRWWAQPPSSPLFLVTRSAFPSRAPEVSFLMRIDLVLFGSDSVQVVII